MCCWLEYSDEQRAQYRVHVTDEWRDTVYCVECMEIVHDTRWTIMKEGLIGVDCLAEFRSICKNGLPMWLTFNDVDPLPAEMVLQNKHKRINEEVYELKYGDTVKSAKLDVDLTGIQRDNLVKDLRAIGDDVTEDTVKAICNKYWTVKKS